MWNPVAFNFNNALVVPAIPLSRIPLTGLPPTKPGSIQQFSLPSISIPTHSKYCCSHCGESYCPGSGGHINCWLHKDFNQATTDRPNFKPKRIRYCSSCSRPYCGSTNGYVCVNADTPQLDKDRPRIPIIDCKTCTRKERKKQLKGQ